MKRVYLSGAMTTESNHPTHFNWWEMVLTARGYHVVNPSRQPEGLTYQEYLRNDIALLMTCDYIFYVNDTTTSKGAFIEKINADACGIRELTKKEIEE